MTASPTNPDTLALSSGDTLDGYTIGPQIGQGGSSVVWQAIHRSSGQTVAVKQLQFTGTAEDDLAARRLRKEARLLESLSQVHPRIIRVLDFIDDHRGAFLVTEYVDGQSLEDLLNESGDPIDPLYALKIVHAVANVLVAVHGQGVVHRDLKPSNLLLPEGGGVKVCDLGLASLIAEQEALPVGSVRYMAPELFTGEPATGRADIYALGMIAYEMFVGRAVFNDVFKTVLRDQRNQAVRWMKWHTNARAAVPPLAQINPKIPQRLSDLVARMMDKDIARRVASAEELAEAIGRHFNKKRPADRTGPARRKAPPAAPNVVEKTAAVRRKRRWPLYVACGVIIVGTVVGGYFILDKRARETEARQHTLDSARELIHRGNDQYQQGFFREALAAFTDASETGVSALDPGLADRIQSGALLSEARILLVEGDLVAAREKLETLDRLNRPDIYSRDTIYNLLDEIDQRQSFAAEMDEISALIEAREFAKAKLRIGAYRGKVLRDEEAAALSQLSIRITAGQGQAYADRALAQAKALADAERFDAAADSLATAMKQYATQAMQDRLAEYQHRSSIARLKQQAQAASDAGRIADAIATYTRLMEQSPSDAHQAALDTLLSQQAMQQGKQLLDTGDTPGAKAAFLRALGYADNAEAKGYLARLEADADRIALATAGDKAYGNGDYGSAIRHYTEALKLDPSDDVRAKLTRSRVRQELEKARQALTADDLVRAKLAYQDALSLDPQAPGAQAGLDKVDTIERYRVELINGDKLRAEGRYARARRTYTQAQAIMDTPEVRLRLDDTEYEQLVSQGKAHIALEQWEAARAALRIASGMSRAQSSDEVKQLLTYIAENQPKPSTP